MRRNFDDGAKLWGKGGVQPKPPTREPRGGHWLSDGEAQIGFPIKQIRQDQSLSCHTFAPPDLVLYCWSSNNDQSK
jgi:hypothetical protein